jgi:hypothetical protein
MFMLIGAAWLVGGFIVPLLDDVRTLAWKKTPCTIQSKNLLVEEIHGEHHVTLYRPDILYTYQVGDVPYSSNDYNLTDYAAAWYAGGKRAVLKRYDHNAACWVNPADASQAVLTREPGMSMALVIFPLAMLLGGFWPVFQYRNRPAAMMRRMLLGDNPQHKIAQRYRRLKHFYVMIASAAAVGIAYITATDLIRDARAGALDPLLGLIGFIVILGTWGIVAALAHAKLQPPAPLHAMTAH